MDEQVVLLQDQVFRWEGPKRKQTLAKAKLGRLVLTDRRLLFLSTGSNDLTVASLAAGGASHGASALLVSSTQDLDLRALHAPGGLEVELSAVTSAQLKGMFKYLVVTYTDPSGAGQASTFTPKNSGMPNGPTWVAQIERLRTS